MWLFKWWFKNAPYSVLHSCFKGILDQVNFRPHEPGSLEGANIRPLKCIWRRKTLVSLSLRAKKIAKKINSFWRDVILHYASIRDNPSTAPEKILSQPLWLNSEIKIGGNQFYISIVQKQMYFLLMIYWKMKVGF